MHGIVELRDRQVIVLPGQVRIYARKSVAKERSHRSIEEQVESAMRQCRKLGLPVSPEDVRAEKPGLGGDLFWEGGGHFSSHMKRQRTRPELTRLVSEVERGLVKVVLVWDHSRLWRSTEICGALVNLFHLKGVLLGDRREFADLDSPEGRKKVYDAAAVAQEYREMSVVNTTRAFDDKRDRGESVTLVRSLGYEPLGDGVLRHVPEEIAIVRRIFGMFVHGEGDRPPMSIIAIAARLTAEGMGDMFPRTLVKDGSDNPDRFIHTATVRRILGSPRYVGKQKHRVTGATFDANEYLFDGHTAVDIDLWNRAQARLSGNSAMPRRRISGRAESGLIRCGVCSKLYNMTHAKVGEGRGGGEVHRSSAWRVQRIRSYHSCEDAPPALPTVEIGVFLKRHLAPLLADELRERRRQADCAAVRNQIAELRVRRSLYESRLRDLLKDTVVGLLSKRPLLSNGLQETGEEVLAELDLEILRLEERASTHEEEIAALDGAAFSDDETFREVLRSVIVWGAVVPSGKPKEKNARGTWTRPKDQGRVLFLTCWGTYHTAVIEFTGQAQEARSTRRTNKIRLAEPHERLGSINDLPDSHRFFRNLRREQIQMKWRGPFREELWAPGYLMSQSLPEIEMPYQVAPPSDR